ncbi:MAG: nitroreductase/quinone reductase family protein [Microthrixaceae bacterium]
MLTSLLIDGAKVVLVASKGGHSDHPDWYRSSRPTRMWRSPAHSVTVPMLARTATGDERAELWPRIVASYKGYEGYQRNTDREIPVVICEPAT